MVSDDEFVDITIEGRFDIAAFDISTGVLDQSIRIQHIVSYLTAERVVHLFALQLGELGFALLFLQLIEATTQNPEGGFLVLKL